MAFSARERDGSFDRDSDQKARERDALLCCEWVGPGSQWAGARGPRHRGRGRPRHRGRGRPSPRYKARGTRLGERSLPVSARRHLSRLPPPLLDCSFRCLSAATSSLFRGRKARRGMASNYVDTAAEEGRFHGHHRSTTPTGAATASPKTMGRSWSSASSAHGHSHGHGAVAKCVCAPATHAGSFKCRLHRTTSSHGHGHPASPPSPAAATTSAAPPPAVPPSSSRTVAAQ